MALLVRPSRSAASGLALALLGLLLLAAPTLAADRDGDGLRDGFETRWGVSDPDKRDSDRDGVIDAAEDPDGDGLGNLGEQRFGSDPGDPDSDGDGTDDAAEDHDGDGRSNARDQDRRRIPKGITPALTKAKKDRPASYDKCFVHRGDARARRCWFGDKRSDTTVALFGDSHMFMWNSGFALAARKEGWRVVTLVKGGCSSAAVPNLGQYLLDRHRSCRAWRANAQRWLSKHQPDLIVIANSDGYRIVDSRGRKLSEAKRVARWKKGLLKTLAALPKGSAVLVLGEAPHNSRDPIKCLKSHPQDISACTTGRDAPGQIQMDGVERAAAAEAGATYGSLFGKVCSYDRCPLVQGKTLMYRDQHHVSSTMARQLAPSIRALLRDAMAAR